MNLPAEAVSPLLLLERFDVGVVQLDEERRVTAMNAYARRVLPVEEKQPFDRMVLGFHPERSQPKVAALLDQAAGLNGCPVSNPPPMAMIINIPERALLIKVTRVADGAQRPQGYTLVFYDITDVISAQAAAAPAAGGPASAPPASARMRLSRLPTLQGQRIAFLDTEDVLSIRSEGHYTQVTSAAGLHFCNLSIGDLEARLDPERFVRVHRSHIVQLQAVLQMWRQDGRVWLRLAGSGEPVPVSRASQAAVLQRLGLAAPGGA
jgi:DNA-binding LytR/AlgR family response regulator